MPRFILIDRASGYIFGDTADFAANLAIPTAVEAARCLDETNGVLGRSYRYTPRRPDGTSWVGYSVYRADIDGSEAVPVVMDGQDQDTIEAVEACCQFAGFVECSGGDDWRPSADDGDDPMGEMMGRNR